MLTDEITITKICSPQTSGIYLRHRLFDLLDQCGSKPIIWLSGVAGSGKTTLISSYLHYKKFFTLWYQLDSRDAELSSFFYYLGQAGKRAPRYRRSPLPLLTPDYLGGLANFSKRYFENLYSKLIRPAVIVFDNYQEIPNDANFHEVMQNGLAIIPGGIKVIFISRESPPPFFSAFVAQNRLHIIGQDELCLDMEEADGLLRVHLNRKVSAATLKKMNTLVQGWVAGLILLSQLSKTTDFSPQIVCRSSNHIFNYFAAELFDRTAAEMQQFLLTTAILPQMTPRSCRELTGLEQAGLILAELNHKNYFTAQHVNRHEVIYQYHPLFREFLLARSQEHFPAPTLLRIKYHAAKILELAGHIEDGAKLYIEAERWRDLTQLILNNAPALLEQGRNQVVAQWLSCLPADVLDDKAWLHYWQGACQLITRPREARGAFEKAYQFFRMTKDSAGLYLAWSGVIESYIYEWENLAPLDYWIKEFHQLFADYPVFPSQEIEIRTVACIFYAVLLRQPE